MDRQAALSFFSSRRRYTRYIGDWSSDVCSSDLFFEHPTVRSLARYLAEKHGERLTEKLELAAEVASPVAAARPREESSERRKRRGAQPAAKGEIGRASCRKRGSSHGVKTRIERP